MAEPLRWDTPGLRWDDPRLHWDGFMPEVPTPMPQSKVTYAVEEVLGFCTSVKAMLNTYKTDMIAAGVDPTTLLAQVDTQLTDLNTKNAAQENLKTQLRDQTALTDTAKNTAYTTGSKGCDLLISAFGRTSAQAREATNLRKGLRPQSRPQPTPPPA